MKIRRRLQAIVLVLLIFSVSSCRLGEWLSEADPGTQAEIEREESIPQNENLENNRQGSGVNKEQ